MASYSRMSKAWWIISTYWNVRMKIKTIIQKIE